MKNGDMPAAPQDRDWKNDAEAAINSPERAGFPSMDGIGLTKREHFAAMAMQGLCSNMDRVVATAEHDGRPEDVDEYLAVLSVAFADALLRELEK